MTARRALVVVIVVLSCTGVLSACTSSDDSATGRTLRALRPASATPATTTTPPAVVCDNALKSYRPTGPLPAPGNMPEGTAMGNIQQRNGPLIVGVDESTLQLSARKLGTNDIEGFEVDLAKVIARAMLGDQAKVKLVRTVTDEKVSFVERGMVDLTVSAVSMNCGRWTQVDFSSPYLTTDQQVLLRADSEVDELQDLARKKVCVTKGSTTIAKLKKAVADVVEVALPARSDCLVALQDGRVEGIASHSTILFGLHAQDEDHTKILDASFDTPYYGIAVATSEGHEFARFVNGVLEQMRDNGELERLYQSWIRAGTATLPTQIEYRD